MKKIFNNLIKSLGHFLNVVKETKEVEPTIVSGLPEKTQEKSKRLTYTKRTD